MNQHRNLDIESLFAVPSVSSFDLPKVGNRIVFSSNRSGQWQLYLGELSRERPLEANQFTYDSESKLEAKFTPDSNSLIYASDYRGDENFDLFFAGVRKPKPRNLTENTPFA
ncbi:MAG: TolB family protein, partial [Nitrososphaerales archaeon]